MDVKYLTGVLMCKKKHGEKMRICLWSDGTWCEIDNIEEYSWMSDDYIKIDVPEEYWDNIEEYIEILTKK